MLPCFTEAGFPVIPDDLLVGDGIGGVEVGVLDTPHERTICGESVVIVIHHIEPTAITRGSVFHPDPPARSRCHRLGGNPEHIVTVLDRGPDRAGHRDYRDITEESLDGFGEKLRRLDGGRAGNQYNFVVTVWPQLLEQQR